MSETPIIYALGLNDLASDFRRAAAELGAVAVAWPWSDVDAPVLEVEGDALRVRYSRTAMDVADSLSTWSEELRACGFPTDVDASREMVIAVARTNEGHWWCPWYASTFDDRDVVSSAISRAASLVAGLNGVGLFEVAVSDRDELTVVDVRTPGAGDVSAEWDTREWNEHVRALLGRAPTHDVEPERRQWMSIVGGVEC